MHNKILRAILVDIIDPKTSKIDAKRRLLELESLVNTFGGIVSISIIQKRGVPDYRTYMGKGKANEILALAEENEVDLVVLNNILKPSQIYNLQEHFKDLELKVWDRVDLILKIFDKHAKSTEAKLQIELASIKHMGPRIFGMGIELSRQAGAMGIRAGQGESNTELMKRHLKSHELNIIKKLQHYEVINEGHIKRRKRQNFKTAALVGYTNAGKSSLLNALTNKGAYVADQLFATLSTRVGKLYIHDATVLENGAYNPGKEILISDTIGFIRDLPPDLIKAFKSTLAETVEADILLHVIDITDPDIHKKIKIVEEILADLGLKDKPKMYILNKIDLIDKSNFGADKEDKDEIYNEYIRRPSGLLKAGIETSKILGWHCIDEENKRFHKAGDDPKKLSKRYDKFNPMFVSSHEKTNLDILISGLEKLI